MFLMSNFECHPGRRRRRRRTYENGARTRSNQVTLFRSRFAESWSMTPDSNSEISVMTNELPVRFPTLQPPYLN